MDDPVPAHRFEVSLERSSYTEEKFKLYTKYQATIHKDFRNRPSGFKSFLVDSPLVPGPIHYKDGRPSHLPEQYGSYHQLYRVDGQLIAIGVIDFLPYCVSSVYFIYDPQYEEYSLGKLSALREISLAKELHDSGVQDLKYLYMGYYIHSCVKMRYKADYSPSFLADPETYEWFPMSFCRPLLDQNRYACFSNTECSLSGSSDISEDEVENMEAPAIHSDWFDKVKIALSVDDKGTLSVLPLTSLGSLKTNRQLLWCVHSLGETAWDRLLLLL